MLKLFIAVLIMFSAVMVQAENFSVEGNSVRNIVTADAQGTSVLYVSELDGSVSCYTTDGNKLWRNATEIPAVMFEIEAADVNGDGSDDLLAASADGYIYCWDSDGRLLWKYYPGHKVRFSELASIKGDAGIQIFAGGNDYTLYELNAIGKLVSKTPIEGVVRKIETGNFLKEGKASIFLMTYRHDKFSWDFMGFLDPQSKAVIQSIPANSAPAEDWDRFMLTDFTVADIDNDRRDDLLYFGVSGIGRTTFIALNGDFQKVAGFQGDQSHTQRYAHVRGTSLLPNKKEIAIQFGGIMYVCDLQGNLMHTGGEKHRKIIYNDLALDARNNMLFGGGQVGGGTGIYSYAVDQANWWQTDHTPIGRMADVEMNMNTLYRQALNYTPPAYQKISEKSWVMITSIKPLPEVAKLNSSDIKFVKQYTWHEDFDRSELVKALGDEALKRDRRGNYTITREYILSVARDHEAKELPFAVWAGHGNDPFYIPAETMEAILEAAPNTCYGFVYAEMANPDDVRYQYFLNHYVPRLATACRKNGKAKLYFRYKNVFWAATSHQEPWRKVFFSGKYSDVLVPSAEDTNARTQELNFIGRVGMLVGGYIDNYAMRLVDDNPTCWRPLSPGGQRTVSPYLRNGALLAAYGARYGLLFNIGYLEDPGMNILFALMKSGALPIVEKEDILSIGSWHLVKDVDEHLIHTIDDGHNMVQYTPDDENAAVSVGQIGWAGTNLPKHDFSRRALGVEYRWLNFLPEMPHGMIPVAPSEYKRTLDSQRIPYTVSDFRVGYQNGKQVPAKQFASTIEATAATGAKKIPLLVKGASWSLIRLDDTHSRLILVDPGYIDPQERGVSIQFQGKIPINAVDILSKEKMRIADSAMDLTVPAGSLRLIDLIYD
jgi:lambda-carrageenase